MVTESRFLKNHPLSQMINTTPIQKIKKGNKEWVGIYLDYRNIPVVGAAMDIPEYSLILVAKIDVSEAFASLKMLNTVVIISGVVCIGVVVGIGCTFAFSTSRPIMDLKNAAERFTKGDLDYRIHMIRNDEIGKLSNSFNIMAEKLSSKINEIKRTAEALRISESKYRLLIDNLPVRISHKNRDSIYISCNESLAKDFCIQPEEITGKTDYDFFPAEISERYRIIDREVIESGQRRDEEIRYNRNGQELIIHTIKVPIKNEKGEITGILDSYIDITEKVNLEREAQQSRHLALIGELAAGVAHEINNPITGVINCAQILLNKSSEGSREKDLGRRIVKEGDRIATIVSKLLSFARTKDKKEKSLTGIQEILPDILTLTEAQLRKESITLKVTIPKDLPGVLANVQEIHQVFLNLINNARYALNQKYSGPHDNKILEIFSEEITVNKRRFIKITFYDHGTGIPAHIRDKIMNPFFTTKPQGKGTGLGLSVCNNIIDDHNGQLNFDSVEGEFTKISIILPVERVRP
ncbi:MAG: HAMP domain-containing protein [wastewater metagenome]|nr:HAMP domain-containing protein [Candidatus Loosdrechtia aerotolerans]